jgi:hypothetical protein
MYSSTYLNWFRRLSILGAVVAGLAASAAGAGIDSRPPDVMMALHFKHEDRIYGRTGGDLSAVASTPSVPVTVVSRPPDVQDAAASVSAATPDVFERYAMAHPYGFDLNFSELVSSPPDVQDAAAALRTTPSPVDRIIAQERGRHGDFRVFGSSLSTPAQSTIVSRPPDVSDAAQVAASVSTVPGNGFAWDDWAIGVGTGLGLALLLGGGIMVGRQQRHRVQPA